MPTRTSPRCTCGFPASRSWRKSGLRRCKKGGSQRRSLASTRAGRKRRSATRFPTSWSIIRCVTRTSIQASRRGVNINHNAIYLECFMDELAKEVGVDPLEFRRKLMTKHPKHLGVLNAVAAKAGWGTPAPQGVYRGLAQAMAFGSYVAACAEISVDGDKIKVQRIVAATDPGYGVNPAQIERQVAGSFVYGLSALFYQECTVKDGRIEQTNFDNYDSMRIAEMPKVETIVMPS